MDPRLSIVVVNYNVRHFLEQCLMAIERAQRGMPLEVFVVDNASVDGSPAMVKRRFPWVKLIENHWNLGFSRANNQALRRARGSYVLVLNPDTLIQEDTLQVLIEALDRDPAIGAVGCKLLNPDGTFQLGSRRSLPTPWVAFTRIIGLSRMFPRNRLFGRYNLTYLPPDQGGEVDVLSGSLMMLRKSALDRVGLFDEDYFMYGEDIDLCYRIRQAGYRIWYEPRTSAIHYKGESTKKGELSRINTFYATMLLFIDKHFKNRYSPPLKALIRIGIAARATAAYIAHFLRGIAVVVIDAALIVGSIILGIRIWLPAYPLMRFRTVLPVYGLVWLSGMYIAGAYRKRGRPSVKPIAVGAILGLLVNASFTYFFKQFAYSRMVVLISFFLIVFSLSLWRFLVRTFGPESAKGPMASLRRAVIVGSGKEGRRILNKLRQRPDKPFEICGFIDFDERAVGSQVDGLEVLATADSIREVIRVERINDVIFSSDRLSNQQILATIAHAQNTGVSFRIVPHKLEYIIAKSNIDEIDSVPLIEMDADYGPVDQAIKRTLDILMGLVGVTLTAPLMLLDCLFGARLQSRRILNERGQERTIRVFTGGIKAFRGLPLLFSVINGSLSVVGATIIEQRPGAAPPYYKPGITGLVQLKTREKKRPLAPAERAYLDLYYLRNRSFIGDLQIVLKSLRR